MKIPKIHLRDFFWLIFVTAVLIGWIGHSQRLERLLDEMRAKRLAADARVAAVEAALTSERESLRQLRLAVTSHGLRHTVRNDGTVYLHQPVEFSNGPFSPIGGR